MSRFAVLLFVIALPGCAVNIERGEWCVKRNQLVFSAPLDSGTFTNRCKSKEVLNRLRS